MDPNWSKKGPPTDCIECILCKSVITFKNKKKDRYVKHMQKDHGAFYNTNLILIINLLERKKILKLIDQVKSDCVDKERKDAAVQTEAVQFSGEAPVQDKDLLASILGVQDLLAQRTAALQDDGSNTSKDDIENIEDVTTLEEGIPMEQLSIESDADTNFNILNITNEDLVKTPEGPVPLQDYSNFSQNALVASKSSSETEKLDGSPSKRTRMAAPEENSQIIIDYVTSTSDYFKERPQEIASATEARALKFTEMEPSLPEGWRARSVARKNGRRDWEFLSPELKVFRSRVGVVEYMRAMGGYTQQEMDRVCPGIRIKKEKH